MVVNCARCGNAADVEDLDDIDFGPFLGQMVCLECWDAENERAWAEADE